MPCPGFGSFAACYVKAGDGSTAYDWTTSTPVDINAEDVHCQEFVAGGTGLRGTRSRNAERRRLIKRKVGGPIELNPAPVDFTTFLAFAGFSNSSGTWSLTETVSPFGLLMNRDKGVFEYTNCKLNSWSISGRAPQMGSDDEPSLVDMRLEVIGTSESVVEDADVAALKASLPAFSTNANTAPYVASDASVTIDSTDYSGDIEQFAIMGSNFLRARYGIGNLDPASICATDRSIMVQAVAAFTADTLALYRAVFGANTLDAEIALTNGNMSTTFTFPAIDIIRRTPTTRNGRRMILCELRGEALMLGTDRELVIVNDDNAAS